MKKALMAVVMIGASIPAFAESGFYGEVALGSMDNDVSVSGGGRIGDERFTYKESLSYGSSTAFSLGGGYQFNDYVAIDASYRNYGNAKDSYIDDYGDQINGSIKTNSINLGVLATFPFAEVFSVYGRLGLASWDLKAEHTDSSAPGEVDKTSEDGTDIYWAAGAAYSFNDQFSLALEYSSLTMEWDESYVETSFDVDWNYDLEYEVKGFSLVGRMSF